MEILREKTACDCRSVSFADRMYYSVKQAADLLGVSERFIYYRLASGEIKGVKFRGRRLISKDAVIEYAQSDEHTQALGA